MRCGPAAGERGRGGGEPRAGGAELGPPGSRTGGGAGRRRRGRRPAGRLGRREMARAGDTGGGVWWGAGDGGVVDPGLVELRRTPPSAVSRHRGRVRLARCVSWLKRTLLIINRISEACDDTRKHEGSPSTR